VSVPYSFAASFEADVVALLVTSEAFYNRVGIHVDPARLRDEKAQVIAAAVRDVYETVGKAPGSLSVILQRLRDEHDRGKLPAAKLAACAEYLLDAIDRGLPPVDVAAHTVADHIRRDKQQEVLDQAFTTYAERGSMAEVARKMEATENIGKVDVSFGVGLDGFAEELDSMGVQQRLPIGFQDIDSEMGGGLARGEFGFWLAGTKVGKSMALVQNAVIGLCAGMHVAVATLELDAVKWRARVIGALTGTPYQDITKFGSKSVAFERYAAMRSDPSFGLGTIVTHKFGGHQTTLPDILDWVSREEDRAKKPVDLLVIDYADKLIGRDTRESDYVQMRDVYEGIRTWAEANLRWAWSASQARRVALGDMPTINDCADSQHKVRCTDLMVGLTRHPDDDNKVSAKVLALRNGEGDGAAAGPLPNGFEFGCFVRNVAVGVEVEEALAGNGKEAKDLGIFG